MAIINMNIDFNLNDIGMIINLFDDLKWYSDSDMKITMMISMVIMIMMNITMVVRITIMMIMMMVVSRCKNSPYNVHAKARNNAYCPW